MEALDLRKAPPRGCREELDGLMMMPRTIDKLRSQLPGGNTGQYWVNPVRVTGLSVFLLKRLGITEEGLQEVVAEAKDDEDVAAWLRANVDTSKYPKINAMISNIEPEHSEDPALVRGFYADTLAAHPELTKVIDIIDTDDRRSF
jgi:Domain of unknown function (DUF5069)